jgi:phosphatidylglycerophosphate synthase
MIDDPFRRALPRYAVPLVHAYQRLGWSPNQVTWLGFAAACAAAVAVAHGALLTALALWWLSRLFDGTDGILARETGTSSDFGSYLDIVLDMAAYSAMVLGFDARFPELHGRWIAMLAGYVLCIASALALGSLEASRALPPRDDRGLRLGAGLAEGGETGIAYSLFLLFPAALPLTTALWLALLAATVGFRTLLARRLLAPPMRAPR